MQFEVRALSGNAVTSVVVEALSEADARAQVAARSLQPISIRTTRNRLGQRGSSRSSRLSILLFSQELLALLEGGLTIVEAVDVLLEKESNAEARSVYAALARGLSEGKSFSACAAELPGIFPPLYVGVLRSAERTSSLPSALTRYIDYQTRSDAVRSKIVSASIYPAILAAVGIAVVLFLSAYVVPRFASVYQGTGRSLPLMSGWLLAWGQFVKANGPQLGAGIAFVLIAVFSWLRLASSREGLSRLLQSLPFFTERIKIYELTRLYLTLGMLLEGGLPITEALALSRGTLRADRRVALDKATKEILNGESIPEAFERAGLTTPVASRFMRVGEQSGRLGEMLIRSARYYDGEISRWIERFTRAFEPALMVIIGLVVGLIVVLLYMPIFDLAGSFQ
jgi:general secretion pathway protein F